MFRSRGCGCSFDWPDILPCPAWLNSRVSDHDRTFWVVFHVWVRWKRWWESNAGRKQFFGWNSSTSSLPGSQHDPRKLNAFHSCVLIHLWYWWRSIVVTSGEWCWGTSFYHKEITMDFFRSLVQLHFTIGRINYFSGVDIWHLSGMWFGKCVGNRV